MTKLQLHLHKKKRSVLTASKKTKPLFVDRLTYLAAVIEPIITIPQALIIFRDQTAAGISLLSWVGYEILTAVWIWYGVVHKEKLILLYQGLFFIIQAIVIAGGVIYGARWL